jgi:tetratricopeptide (TPR) repeat protein
MNWTCRLLAMALAAGPSLSLNLHAQTPENSRSTEQAIEQYQHVLDSTPNRTARIDSANGIAHLYEGAGKFDDSKKYYQMASDLDPKDPEPYFAIGRIDWIECMQRDMEEGAKLGLKPGEHPNPSKNPDQKKACDELKAKDTPTIKEGIDSLNKAMKLRPNDHGGTEIMIEMYIEKANMECDDLAAREEDQKAVAAWMNTLGSVLTMVALIGGTIIAGFDPETKHVSA